MFSKKQKYETAPEQTIIPDVGQLYNELNEAYENHDIRKIKKIKQAGISLGHAFVLYEACERLGEQPTEKDLAQALYNSVQIRGYNIDDPATSTGHLYRQLYGRNFLDSGFAVLEESRAIAYTSKLELQNMQKIGEALVVPYEQLIDEHKHILEKIIHEKGLDALDAENSGLIIKKTSRLMPYASSAEFEDICAKTEVKNNVPYARLLEIRGTTEDSNVRQQVEADIDRLNKKVLRSRGYITDLKWDVILRNDFGVE